MPFLCVDEPHPRLRRLSSRSGSFRLSIDRSYCPVCFGGRIRAAHDVIVRPILTFNSLSPLDRQAKISNEQASQSSTLLHSPSSSRTLQHASVLFHPCPPLLLQDLKSLKHTRFYHLFPPFFPLLLSLRPIQYFFILLPLPPLRQITPE